MRPKILVTHPLIEGGLDPLGGRYDLQQAEGLTTEQVAEAIEGVEALIPLLTVRITDDVLRRADRLKVVANVAVGYDNIDVEAATRRGIWVTNTPGVLTEATADLTWAIMLGLVRRVIEGHRMMLEGRYHGWELTMLLGADMGGKTLGLVGFGQIGRAVARRAAGFGMDLIFFDPAVGEEEVDLGLSRARGVPLEELMRRSDVVSLHTPLTDETHHLIDARRLGWMKPSAYLVNTSRGPVIDEAALVEHLRAGRIAGAALDVYEHEPRLAPGLAELKNVLLLPHLGSATRETRTAMARLAARNADAVLSGRPPLTPVNSL
jgi:glyoxylate reductase